MIEDTTADMVRYVAMQNEGDDNWHVLDKDNGVHMNDKAMTQEQAEDEASFLNSDRLAQRPRFF